MNEKLLRIYLNDHLAGSVGAIGQAEHCLAHNRESELGAFLERLLKEIEEDQAVLKDLIGRIGGAENPLKKTAAWVSEKVQRIKPSGEVIGYSDLNRLEELETLLLGIAGKRALWDLLDAISASDDRLRAVDFRALAQRAQRQRDEVEAFRIDAARRAFAPGTEATEETP